MQIKKLNYYKKEITQIAIKDFWLFKVLYNEAYGNDQEKHFEDALKKLTNISELFKDNVIKCIW
jgi:hypothetical protein